jgi:hypothetical protein
MLRYLFALDAAIAVLGASMVIGVGISALLLAVHLDTAPEQRGAMLNLLILTAAYTAVTAAAVAAAWAIRARQAWHWLAQAAVVATAVASFYISIAMLASP